MAVIQNIICSVCGQPRQVCCGAAHWPTVCRECSASKAAKERADRLAAVAALPLEERLARIEAWIEDYKPPVPMSELLF